MSAKKRISKKAWIILVVTLVIQILFDPLLGILHFGEQLQARIGLPSARSKWQSQRITHYKFDVSGGVAMACFFDGNVEVKNEVIIHTGPRSDAGTHQNELFDLGFWALKDGYSICNPKIYTVPLLFEEVEHWLPKVPSLFTGLSFSITEISFDPQYGFVSHFSFGNCGGQGLLSPRISDCSGGFRIENFEALDK